MKEWIALFSQTGSELLAVCKALDRYPDAIITTNYTSVNTELLSVIRDRKIPFHMMPKPSKVQYIQLLGDCDLVTLHGWLYIVPEVICCQYAIYNGHPGLITKYPELKGRDPQKKAYDLQLPTSGSVIHKVIGEVDSGEIIYSAEISIAQKSLPDTMCALHEASIRLWINFLSKELYK